MYSPIIRFPGVEDVLSIVNGVKHDGKDDEAIVAVLERAPWPQLAQDAIQIHVYALLATSRHYVALLSTSVEASDSFSYHAGCRFFPYIDPIKL